MKRLFLSVLVMMPFILAAQTNELSSLMSKLQQTVASVQTASKSYDTKVTFVPPAVMKCSVEESDQKGMKVNYIYEINLADLDAYAVREQTQKDLISVVLVVKNKQKLIKVYKNEEVQPYDFESRIIAKDIDNARAISEIIKKAIPPAEKAVAEKLKLTGYDAAANWLTTNIKTVDLGVKSYKQSITKGEKVANFVFTQTTSDSKSATEEVYTFNLADINPNSIAFRISGNSFGVSMETMQRARYIHLRKNGEVKPFVNDLLIMANNVDEARDIKTVLLSIIPQAVEKVKADMGTVANEKDGLQKLVQLTSTIANGDTEIKQTLEPNCLATLKQTQTDPKKTESALYKFNWVDISALGSTVEVAGSEMYLELRVNEDKKLVMLTKNEIFNGYDNSLRLYMPGIEQARRAKFLMDRIVEKCKASYKEPFTDGNSALAFVKASVKEVSIDALTLKQKLEPAETGSKDKFKLTVQEINAKGSGGEQLFEFGLADINAQTIEIEVRGKWLYVVMETNFKAKILKAYKDGKVLPYTNKVELAINDVDAARNVVSALKKGIKAIKPN